MKQYLNRNMNIGVALAKTRRGGEEQNSKPRRQHVQSQEVRKQSTLSVQTKVQDVCRLGLRESRVGRKTGEDREAGSCRAGKRFQVCTTPRTRGSHQKIFNSKVWVK